MSQKRTNIAAGLVSAGITLSAAMTETELAEAMRIIQVGGGTLSKAADSAVVAGTFDTFRVGQVDAPTHYITIKALVPGAGTGIVSVQVVDAAGDTLAVTNVAGVITISLANTTDSKNTLTLIKAAIDAANSSTLGVTHSVATFITGTASTQVVHGGTNDSGVLTSAGPAAGGVQAVSAGAIASFAGLSYVPSA